MRSGKKGVGSPSPPPTTRVKELPRTQQRHRRRGAIDKVTLGGEDGAAPKAAACRLASILVESTCVDPHLGVKPHFLGEISSLPVAVCSKPGPRRGAGEVGGEAGEGGEGTADVLELRPRLLRQPRPTRVGGTLAGGGDRLACSTGS